MRDKNSGRTIPQRQDDRVRISELLLKGWMQKDIANELGLSRSQVCRDIQVIERHRQMAAVRNMDKLRGRELAKLDLIEREAWAAWEKSKQTFHSKRTKSTAGIPTSIEKKEEERNGDPRYMDIIMTCQKRRAELLGLDAPQKIAPTSPDGKQAWTAVQIVEVVRPSEKE